MSMAHSLETRSPLIDHKVVEYAASIPGHLKLKGNRLKYLLRKVAGRYLPDELITRKKQGFGFPLGIWMRTELRQFMQNLFAESRMIELGIFDAGYVRQLIGEHLSGRRDHNYRLWLLMNLEVWYQMRFEGRSVAAMGAEIERLLGKPQAGRARLDAAD
jgi:asparagine synthase (glutamine-hydrolysing)